VNGDPALAGIIGVSSLDIKSNAKVVYVLAHSMRMLQHRGKAYWKISSKDKFVDGHGSLPTDEYLLKFTGLEKLSGNIGLGYLSKRYPQFQSMNTISAALDGFFVDTEKLHLHPYIDDARDHDSLFKIYHIFTNLLLEKKRPDRAIDFLDRHLRGNLLLMTKNAIYAFRNSTGFKPLVMATNKKKSMYLLASENSLQTSLVDLKFKDVLPGQLIRLSDKDGLEIIEKLDYSNLMLDPFEFVRESNVAATINGKSIYQVRKNIGKEQAKFLSRWLDIDSAHAEPDYTRPMTLGFSNEYHKHHENFDISEGIIKDRYDDSDHMIDFSEEVSKNKLLSTGRSLKFVVKELISSKSVATIQGTIQTGSTVMETMYYLRDAGARKITVVVAYPPTIDGRQVGLYTQNRDLIANKYVGQVSSIDHINERIGMQIGADTVYYNSPEILAKGIGLPENNLWFPEWVRFLDYRI
jgi:amidophosphoribosyltransferase